MLIGACLEQFDTLGVTPHVRETARQATVVASLEERLRAAGDAISRGRALRVDEAVALALGLDVRGV
jgi:hypothetical protein